MHCIGSLKSFCSESNFVSTTFSKSGKKVSTREIYFVTDGDLKINTHPTAVLMRSPPLKGSMRESQMRAGHQPSSSAVLYVQISSSLS